MFKGTSWFFVYWLMLTPMALANSFYETPPTGWYAGDQFKITQQQKIKEPPKTATAAKSSAHPVIQRMNKIKAELELATQSAYLSVYDNEPLSQQLDKIDKMMTLNSLHLDNSERFSQIGQLVSLRNSALDSKIETPLNITAQRNKKREQQQEVEAAVKQFFQSHGLYFFVQSNCKACHNMGPVVKSFAKQYNALVIAVSPDRKGIPDYPNPVADNGIMKKMKVERTPSLFAVNPNTNQAIKLSHRLTSFRELEDVIYLFGTLNALQAVGESFG